jgi:hypothetical protein
VAPRSQRHEAARSNAAAMVQVALLVTTRKMTLRYANLGELAPKTVTTEDRERMLAVLRLAKLKREPWRRRERWS